jgi:regulator of protease activity HflC (stomatin/prohibitin superfamily)
MVLKARTCFANSRGRLAAKQDLREQVREIPHQTSITKDNAPISIDFLWYYKILDPTQSVLQVGNFESAAQGMATTTLRAGYRQHVVGLGALRT